MISSARSQREGDGSRRNHHHEIWLRHCRYCRGCKPIQAEGLNTETCCRINYVIEGANVSGRCVKRGADQVEHPTIFRIGKTSVRSE